MLARLGELPSGDGWAYEVKWDGFRAIVSTGAGAAVHPDVLDPKLGTLAHRLVGAFRSCANDDGIDPAGDGAEIVVCA
jgi:hypothetical protein